MPAIRRHPAGPRGGRRTGVTVGVRRRPRLRPIPGPVQPGDVVLGEDSRFIFEMGEDGLSVFYVLQISNASSTPVQPRHAGRVRAASAGARRGGARGLFAAGEGGRPPAGDQRAVRSGQHAGAGRLHRAVWRGGHGDRAAAADSVEARRRRGAEGREHAAQLAADARAADHAGQRQSLYRRPRRRGGGGFGAAVRILRDAASFDLAPERRARPRAADPRRRRMVAVPRRRSAAPRATDSAASSRRAGIDCSTS